MTPAELVAARKEAAETARSAVRSLDAQLGAVRAVDPPSAWTPILDTLDQLTAAVRLALPPEPAPPPPPAEVPATTTTAESPTPGRPSRRRRSE